MMTDTSSTNRNGGDPPPIAGGAPVQDQRIQDDESRNHESKNHPTKNHQENQDAGFQGPGVSEAIVAQPPANQPPVQEAKAKQRRIAVAKIVVNTDTDNVPLSPWRHRLRQCASWLTSAAIHLLLLAAAALWVIKLSQPRVEAISFQIADSEAPPIASNEPLGVPNAEPSPDVASYEQITVNLAIAASDLPSSGPPSPQEGAHSDPLEDVGRVGMRFARGGKVQGALGGRGPEGRTRLGSMFGANRASEAAVASGLRWLVRHQRDDGSWRFNHQQGLCEGQCRHPGTAAQSTAATGIALLAFLGAGQTQVHGDYQNVVRQGLTNLRKRMLSTPHGGDLREGTMYAQGIATIALCEAYGMTQDVELKDAASRAVQFILHAQDPSGGGWRYNPGQPGDTTVSGWQLMALKSAQMTYMQVPPPVFAAAGRYLDGVQADVGAHYGYQGPGKEQTTTAIGLLCRMYLGWGQDHPGISQGVRFLYVTGPSADNMYYNYYATQVMFHFGGDSWNSWNVRMRDKLIREQATQGHEAGSWYYGGGKLESGGRLLSTALSIMTLEVYYRYLPLYKSGVLEAEF